MSKKVMGSISDFELMDRSFGTVDLTRNGKVFEVPVQSLHDSEMHGISLLCKPPEPPKRKEAKLDDRGKQMIDVKTKNMIFETVSDTTDEAYVEKVRECDRRRNLMITVHGLRIDWGDLKKVDDKIDFVSKKFSSSEVIEILAKVLELGVVDQEVLEAEKNASSRSEAAQSGSADLSSSS